MKEEEELLYRMALTLIPRVSASLARTLIGESGSAGSLFEKTNAQPSTIEKLMQKNGIRADLAGILRICEKELEFADEHHIRCLTENQAEYPSQLRECSDAPLVLYCRGNADLNRLHMISIVGTRHATDYGKEFCMRFVKELKELIPDVVIVSGLAYGIDICAHRAALDNGAQTVGVLAHGLDRLYPAVHRDTARRMTDCGGLVTEFMSGTNPDKQNFVKRNRIIAGLCDATVVVESASKGGALITAEIAESYNRDCFAVPGRIGDAYSEGCNKLISTNRASLLTDAAELVKAMNWETATSQSPQGIQRQLFVELTREEQAVYDLLAKQADGMQINVLAVAGNIAVNKLSSLLFGLELKGVVRSLAGGVYKALQP